MKLHRFRLGWLVAAVCCWTARPALAATFTWSGNAPAPDNHNWFDAQNWSPPNGVPGSGDSAVIGLGRTVSIDQPATVGSLSVTACTLQGAGTLTVQNTFECQDALLLVGGGITVNGAWNIDPVPSIPVYNTTTLDCALQAAGSATISSNAVLEFGAAVNLVNNGVFNLADGSQLVLLNGPGAFFINNGSFIAGNAVCGGGQSVFTNAASGTVSVNPGATLHLQGVLADNGAFSPGSNALISVTAAAALHEGAVFGGNGQTALLGLASVDGTVTVRRRLQLGDANHSPVLTLNGVLEVAPNGQLTWLSGVIQGAGTNVTGALLVDLTGDGFGALVINNLNGLELRNTTLTNNGEVDWMDSSTFFLANGARIVNNVSFVAEGDGVLLVNDGSPALFNNDRGTFLKFVGSTNPGAATRIALPFYGGVVSASQGRIQLSGGGLIGAIAASNNCSVTLEGASFTTSDYSVITGPGTAILAGGANLFLGPGQVLSVEGNLQSSGTISGYGELAISDTPVLSDGPSGSFTWVSGTIALTNPASAGLTNGGGAQGVLNQGKFFILGPGNPKHLQATTLVNQGVLVWSTDDSGGGVYAGDSVVLDNRGVILINCDSYLNNNASLTPPVFTNGPGATITKLGGSGTTSVGFRLVNQGSITASKGMIEFLVYSDSAFGSGSPPQAEIVLNGAEVKFDNPATIHARILGSGTLSGSFTVDSELDASIMKIEGSMTNNAKVVAGDAPGLLSFTSGNFSQTPNGTLVVPIRGTNAANPDFGLLTLPNLGVVNLDGALEVDLTDGYAPPVGASFPIISGLQRDGTFAHVLLPQGFALNYTSGGATLVVTGAVPAQILAPQISAGQFQFGFNTILGRDYHVQYSADLASGVWNPLTNFTGAGGLWQIQLHPPLPSQRFFRVANP